MKTPIINARSYIMRHDETLSMSGSLLHKHINRDLLVKNPKEGKDSVAALVNLL